MNKTVRLAAAIVAVLVVATVGSPASATHGGIHPTFRQETDFFQCLSGNRVQNVGRNSGQVPTWGTTAPTQTLQAGGGCILYENLLTNTGTFTSPWDFAIEGTFIGNLKTITFEIYLANAPVASIAEGTANATLLVDGAPVHTATQTTFPLQPEGNLKKMVFSYTKLEKLFADQDGDGDTERTILFSWGSFNEQQNVFAWGATDAPSKVVFNPATAAPQKFPVA